MNGDPGEILFQFQLVHCSNAEAAINVYHFTGDTTRQIRA
jgi:hypothetical protein